MKAERDTSNRTSSGRDLVPLKTSVIDDELAKLGLSFTRQAGAAGNVLAMPTRPDKSPDTNLRCGGNRRSQRQLIEVAPQI